MRREGRKEGGKEGGREGKREGRKEEGSGWREGERVRRGMVAP